MCFMIVLLLEQEQVLVVIFHLSKSNLKTLVIDRSDINKEYNSIDQIQKKFVKNISPKQIFLI